MKTNVVSRLKNKVIHCIKNIGNTMRFHRMDKENLLVVNAWMFLYGEDPEHNNLGDELNYYLLKELSGKQIVNCFNLYVPDLENITCIGSIVDSMSNSNSVIWGTGAISDKRNMRVKPRKICAVRGALTRQYLISQGIECPEVYGDPALLLPRIYAPKCENKYKIGIIPHYVDADNKVIDALVRQNPQEIKVIQMHGYNDWHEIIDMINECSFIASSSLHGLILADAYDVPNVWIEFSDKVAGSGFKFRDYFSAVGRSEQVPMRITASTFACDLMAYKSLWHPIQIDLDKLLDACPFQVASQYKRNPC